MQKQSHIKIAPPNKLFYIDYIKVGMTVLVILNHTVITYGGPGGWYYSEKTVHIGALIPMTMFVSINQSFFMGFFFLLAAFFTHSSYERKGAGRFITDRILRLGIPLIFYSFFLSPVLSYLIHFFANQHDITYFQYLGGFKNWIDFGVLWFVAALLLFTLMYVLWRFTFKSIQKNPLLFPKSGTILLFAAVLGIVSFFVRIVFPVGWVLHPLGFQLGHFPQYIALFIVGLLAYKNNWFDKLSAHMGKQFSIASLLLLFLFPMFYFIKKLFNMPVAWFSGGLHWQSLLYAVWEQCIGISILTTLLAKGKKSWNNPSVLLSRLSRCSFAVYIFHPLILIILSLSIRNWLVDPSIKLLVVAPLAVIGSFLLGFLVVQIPGVKRII